MEQQVKEQNNRMAQMRMQVEEMQNTLTRLSRFNHKLRSIAPLDNTEEAGKPAISGPNGSVIKDREATFEEEKHGLLEKLEKDIVQLSAQGLRQEESLKELIDFFSKRAEIRLSTPSIWPVRGWISSGYGYRKSPYTGKRQFHAGIDIAASYGSDVKSTAAGIIIFSGRKQGYGKVVEIDHGNGFITRYAHNSKLLVKKGRRVSRAETIAKVGDSGRTTGPHVHYEVQLNGIKVNPYKYIVDDVADARR
jgi:murein DD-endopeptidase MepM/ murein hydrolase activator NlpD